MVEHPSSKVREGWGFARAAKESFAFLLERGFQLTSEEVTRLRYESSEVFVGVYQSIRVDCYIDCQVGLLAQPKNRMSMYEIARIEHAPNWGDTLRPESAEEMRRDVPLLAERLRSYGHRVLIGESSAYDDVRGLRRAYTAQFARRALGDDEGEA